MVLMIWCGFNQDAVKASHGLHDFGANPPTILFLKDPGKVNMIKNSINLNTY
jgi:hypothetical protein